uniref:Haemagluttinin repeat n=1 Tax=Candidatus Kentrum sp. LPFa TaxID=2126335 RepID=A0A450WZU2_9GAMM|nr:MAG: Haemagluttinin repeat [Candidatus Kentron sp. LPFa]
MQAVDLLVDTGRNLTVASRQNKDRSNSSQFGYSTSTTNSFLIPTGGGVSGGRGYDLRKWVDQQTEMIGTGSVSIKTGGNTHLKGTAIANRAADGTDGGNLTLETASLTVEEIKDIDKANQWSAGVTTSMSSTSLQMAMGGHKKAQLNYATIGQGNVLIDGSEDTVAGLNRDISQTTKVLANRKTGGLDANVSVDHRVFTEKGRQSIATDFYDTYDHVKDIGNAVGDYLDSDKDVSLSHYSRVVGDGARKRSYLKSAVFYEKDTREGLNRADASAEEAQGSMQNMVDGLTGQEETSVVIYDGDPNTIGVDSNLPTDNTEFNKNLAKGGYSSTSDGIGVNAWQTDMTSTDDKVQVIGHESYRVIADKKGYGYNDQTETALAKRYGESTRDTWNAYSAIGGYETNRNAGSISSGDWLAQNRGSSVVKSGNKWIGRQDSREMEPFIVTTAIITAAAIYATYEGEGNPVEGVQKIGRGEDTLSLAVDSAIKEGVNLAYEYAPEATEVTLSKVEDVSEYAGKVVQFVDEKTGRIVSSSWNNLPPETKDFLKGSGKILAVTSSAVSVANKAKSVVTKVKAVSKVKKGTTVIGRTDDLKNPKNLKNGEQSLLDRLPDQGNPKANWKQNSNVLRQEMSKRSPIRDVSPGDTSGQFLNAERNLLRNQGWTFDSKTNYWMPPKQ